MSTPTYEKQSSAVHNLGLIMINLATAIRGNIEQTFENRVAQLLSHILRTALQLDGTLTVAGLTTLANATISEQATDYTADGAITLTSGLHTISKTSAAAMTVAAPATDGLRLHIVANTLFAHVVTFTGATYCNGTAAKTTLTLTAFKGSGVVVKSKGGVWLVESISTITSVA